MRNHTSISEQTGYCTIQPSRAEWWCTRLYWGWLCAMFPVAIGWSVLHLSPAGSQFVLTAGMLGAVPVALAALTLIRRLDSRDVRRSGLLLCPSCRHPMLADEEQGLVRCPECGYRNWADLVRTAWEAEYGINLEHIRTADALAREHSVERGAETSE